LCYVDNKRLSDKERENPPKIGSVITFRYQELSDMGIPRFPTYVGVRIDIDWDQLKKESPKQEEEAPKGIKWNIGN
jgi:hypothetical protein